jgi:4-coumarate--CoA ligase
MIVFESRLPAVAPPAVTVTQRVMATLAATPDRVVLTDGPSGDAMTGRALIDAIEAFGGGLKAAGLGPGDKVALMAPNSPAFVVAFHGAAWAGCTVTTMNPTYTAEEARHQIVDAGARVLVVGGPAAALAAEVVEGLGLEHVLATEPGHGYPTLDALTGPPLKAQVPVDLARDVAVLPYSSGTTGLPKGVMLSHANIVANVEQVLGAFPVEPGETTVAFLPFFHIYGMVPLMNGYLAAGGCLATMPRFDLELFLRLVDEHRVRKAFIVPPVAVALAKDPRVDDVNLESLGYLISGAAPLGGDITDAVSARLGCQATQAYGMTEMSPVSHICPLDAPRKGAVGLALPNVRCRIVDPETGEDRGAGEEGELWVSGPNIMLGYHGQPEATAETLTEDGWLKTGDIALIDEDGYCFIRDRRKELIKVKGFAVAPAELEAVLLTHPDIVDVAVIGVPDEESGEAPAAFVVPRKGTAPDLDTAQAHVGEHLAHYKQIRRLVLTDAIPKSASGKILRRELRTRYIE